MAYAFFLHVNEQLSRTIIAHRNKEAFGFFLLFVSLCKHRGRQLHSIFGQCGCTIHANVAYQRTSLCAIDGETQARGLHRGETNDALIANGSQSRCTFGRAFVAQLHPFSVHQCFERETLHALAQCDILLRHKAIYCCWAFKAKR